MEVHKKSNPPIADKTFVEAAGQAIGGHEKNTKSGSSYEPRIQEPGDNFNPDTLVYKTAASVLFNNGYGPIPVDGKAPLVANWNNCTIDEEKVSSWCTRYPEANVGVQNVSALDFDIYDHGIAEHMRQYISHRFGDDGAILLRYGNAPKSLIPARADVTTKLCSAGYSTPDGYTCRIELLATGKQQWVALGTHPDTGKPYHWIDSKSPLNTPPEDLICLTESDIENIYTEFERVCAERGFTRVKERTGFRTKPPVKQGNGSGKALAQPTSLQGLPETSLDDYNQNGADHFRDVLISEGWNPSGSTGTGQQAVDGYTFETDYEHWTRPGKEDGVSASLFYNPETGKYYLHVFSTSTELEEGTHSIGYAFAQLFHGSNMSAAREDLQEQGFTGKMRTLEETFTGLADEDQATFRRLAELNPAEYDRVRKAEADRLGMRVGTLDSEVAKLRPVGTQEGVESLLPDLEPWSEPVDGDELLEELYTIIRMYVVLPPLYAVAIALWVMLTYVFDVFRICPKLLVSSPTKRCGKSTLLEVLLALVFRGLSAANCSPAAMYRVVEQLKTTLLIDEFDSFLKGNDELRGIINCGHTKSSANVLRVNPDTLEVECIFTYGPQGLFGIGSAPDTVKDRSIECQLPRKLTGEKVQKLPLDLSEQLHDLRRKCRRWADDSLELLKDADPSDIPDVGNDRAVDNWTPLLAIADLAGGLWSETARAAMEAIELKDCADSATISEKLLADIRGILDGYNQSNILSATLVDQLVALEGRPWSEWRRGRHLSTNSLSRLLSPYGVQSRSVRVTPITYRSVSSAVTKSPSRGVGYRVADLVPLFDRYLGPKDQE